MTTLEIEDRMMWRVDSVTNFVLVSWMPVALKFILNQPWSWVVRGDHSSPCSSSGNCTDVPGFRKEWPKHNGEWPRKNSGTRLTSHETLSPTMGLKCRRGPGSAITSATTSSVLVSNQIRRNAFIKRHLQALTVTVSLSEQCISFSMDSPIPVQITTYS